MEQNEIDRLGRLIAASALPSEIAPHPASAAPRTDAFCLFSDYGSPAWQDALLLSHNTLERGNADHKRQLAAARADALDEAAARAFELEQCSSHFIAEEIRALKEK